MLREIQREEQNTMILVTRDPNIAASSDRCLSLEQLNKRA
jgi:predicted ABC-type transport system involved in lysophospholipase L1 biosynthesis ATPase subunit